jgi:hypothetical protein
VNKPWDGRVTICKPGIAQGAETAEDWLRILAKPRICKCSHSSSIHNRKATKKDKRICSGIGCDCKEFIQA